MYGGERICVTRNGKLAAVVVSVEDLEALGSFEMAEDIAAYRAAKSEDDGTRISLAKLHADLNMRHIKLSSPAEPRVGSKSCRHQYEPK